MPILTLLRINTELFRPNRPTKLYTEAHFTAFIKSFLRMHKGRKPKTYTEEFIDAYLKGLEGPISFETFRSHMQSLIEATSYLRHGIPRRGTLTHRFHYLQTGLHPWMEEFEWLCHTSVNAFPQLVHLPHQHPHRGITVASDWAQALSGHQSQLRAEHFRFTSHFNLETKEISVSLTTSLDATAFLKLSLVRLNPDDDLYRIILNWNKGEADSLNLGSMQLAGLIFIARNLDEQTPAFKSAPKPEYMLEIDIPLPRPKKTPVRQAKPKTRPEEAPANDKTTPES